MESPESPKEAASPTMSTKDASPSHLPIPIQSISSSSTTPPIAIESGTGTRNNQWNDHGRRMSMHMSSRSRYQNNHHQNYNHRQRFRYQNYNQNIRGMRPSRPFGSSWQNPEKLCPPGAGPPPPPYFQSLQQPYLEPRFRTQFSGPIMGPNSNSNAFFADLLSSSGSGPDDEYVPEPMYRIQLRQQLGSLEAVSSSSTLDTNSSNNTFETNGGYFADLSSEESFASTSTDATDDSNTSLSTNVLELSDTDSFNSSLNSDLMLSTKFIETAGTFIETYVAVSTRYVLIAKHRSERRASFGVWMADSSELNFSDLMPETRPQCSKSVLIHGGTRCVNAMKAKGFNRIKVIMESDFFVKNVAEWTRKFMSDACNGYPLTGVSNWDEYKYLHEIEELCQSFQGMIVKWSYVCTKTEGIEKAKRLARDILPSDSFFN